MTWESRRNTRNTYYVKSLRRDGKRFKLFVGRGLAAQLLAERDALRREARRARREANRAALDTVRSMDQAIHEIDKITDNFMAAEMFETGHHYHSGWRRRRT